MELRFGDVTIACTNTDRVVFPDVGVTKGDLIAYYRDVADVMVPELRGRPLTIERFTKGLAGGGFYQKHYQKHFPAWVAKVTIPGSGGKRGGGEGVVYPVCDDAATLTYLANQGAIAFHVGTSHADSLDAPDFVVFDLDPPDGRFDLAKRAAKAVRELCVDLDLPAFVKTSGSKGLHVFVPTDGRADYGEVGQFCKRAAALLCELHPDLLTTEFYKKDRKGRLFVDTLRNGLGATVVAAWSVRGKPGAPVSAPIAWSELEDPELAPDGIRLRDVQGRLGRFGDPWEDLRGREGDLRGAISRLG